MLVQGDWVLLPVLWIALAGLERAVVHEPELHHILRERIALGATQQNDSTGGAHPSTFPWFVRYNIAHFSGGRPIMVYPMNALANSQIKEIDKFLNQAGLPPELRPTVARYTGQESQEERERIRQDKPDVLLTNFMMLELLMTRQSPPRPTGDRERPRA